VSALRAGEACGKSEVSGLPLKPRTKTYRMKSVGSLRFHNLYELSSDSAPRSRAAAPRWPPALRRYRGQTTGPRAARLLEISHEVRLHFRPLCQIDPLDRSNLRTLWLRFAGHFSFPPRTSNYTVCHGAGIHFRACKHVNNLCKALNPRSGNHQSMATLLTAMVNLRCLAWALRLQFRVLAQRSHKTYELIRTLCFSSADSGVRFNSAFNFSKSSLNSR